MVKPVGARCNLDCTYCFYLHKERLLGQGSAPVMSDEVLEEHVRQYLDAQTADTVVFSWQGGEPTLAGLPFFERAMALQERYRRPAVRVENDLQTNGTLLDDRWARFLAEHRFQVGLSVDGPPELHDRHRVSRGGGPTSGAVLRAAELLRRHAVPFTAMCVVHRENARRPLEVYRFLARELGTWRIQFTPCVERRDFQGIAPWHWPPATLPVSGTPAARPGGEGSVVADWSVDPDDYGSFLCAVWDEWLANDLGRIHVNLFETAVAVTVGLPAQTCTQSELCGKALALEHDGSLYACDHFVYPEFALGNVLREHEGQAAFSARQRAFGFAKRNALPSRCRACPHLALCWGECPKNRFVRTVGGEAGLNYLCPGLERFYAHARAGLDRIARQLGLRVEAETT
jgi:uncharacterized protein